MDLRRPVRGTVESDRPEADNWLSIPLVVNNEWFVKVFAQQNSLVHALIPLDRVPDLC